MEDIQDKIDQTFKKLQIKADHMYRFISVFNPENGFYFRTGIINENGVETETDPFMTSFPELLDIGIMGSCNFGRSGLCIKSGVQCYQDGLNKEEPNMSFENFKRIIDESKGKVFQVALGGRGDPDQHENFEEILEYCRNNNIVPNFTSSGLGFNKKIADTCKEYCGAVAISWYNSEYTLKAINLLLERGIKTNIHYVVGNNTITKLINILENNLFPKEINAVIFLLHKPVGLGKKENVLRYNDPLVKQFFEMIDSKAYQFKIGFDSCSLSGLINFTSHIDFAYLDACEGARFSMYISPSMIALPCSFDQEMYYGYNISNSTIQEAWNSRQFNKFRNLLRNACPNCKDKNICMGGCPLKPEIILCKRPERSMGV